MNEPYSLMIHGGAGALVQASGRENREIYLTSMGKILDAGRDMLAKGATALDTVEQCAMLLEDDPLYNAGHGSVLNDEGSVEMDAAIMDGSNLKAGGVAGVVLIKNPTQLARQVLETCHPVLLISEGAMEFAGCAGIETVPSDYFIIKRRVDQWRQSGGKIVLDHDESDGGVPEEGEKYGTIGAVAMDRTGSLAAATSTGGLVNKMLGRVGDSPIVGSGVFADNETCAVSCTGIGEDFMRTVLAKTIADMIHYKNLSAEEAVLEGMHYLRRKVNGEGGAIVIDNKGRCGSCHTTRKMIHGWIEHAGPNRVHFTSESRI